MYERDIRLSLSKLDRPINRSESFLILDTEGLDAIERDNIRDTSMIHFDRTMVLFCLSVSQAVIINVKGDIGSEMQNLLQICAYSLQRLKVNKVKAPRIFFVLNQQADPDPNKHLDSINLLMEKLSTESCLMETEGVKISDLIQVSRENLFILPSAFNSQQVNKPGAKLFDSNVIKLSPTITFADKCSKLRIGIINQLDHMPLGDRAPFESMSEWMEMAGIIWDTIIRYQDIVKYRNLEELICSNKLSKIVTELLENNIYNNHKEFADLTKELCKEIDSIESYLHPDIILTKVMLKFDEVFVKHQEICSREFRIKIQEDPLLKKMEHICKESNTTMKRLIYVVRKQHEDQLKLQIKSVLTEIKLSESMKKFQEEIIKNVDKYLGFSIKEQEKAFEETWNETFGIEDHEEESRECEENFSNLYSIFKMEYNAMENKQSIFTLFRNFNFDLDYILSSIKEDIMRRCHEPFELPQEDKLFYPLYDHHIPIKEMSTYNGRSHYSYVCQRTLFKLEKPWYKLYAVVELTRFRWIPSKCVGLLRHCSGIYNHPDVIWKFPKHKQLDYLTSALRSPDDLEVSTWQRFIDDISSDTLKHLETSSNVSHAIVKQIIHEFCFRIRLFNHEFAFIHACLSNTAERTLSTLVFAYAFKFLWSQKAKIRRENREKKDNKRQDHLQYFLQKIKNRKMARGTWNRDTMAESDKKFSQKYASDYLASVKRGLITFEQQNYLKTFLEDRKELLSHESILNLAQDVLFKELLKDPGEEVTDTENFVVQFICNRNHLFKLMFEEKWAEMENILYQTISQNLKMGFEKKTSVLINTVSKLLHELDDKSHEMVSTRGFDSDSNFESVEFGELDLAEKKELPFKAMNTYLKNYFDPTITPESFSQHFFNIFEVNGHKFRVSDTYSLCCKPTEPILDEDTFKKLENTKMFNTTELIFNIYEYIKQFKLTLKHYRVELKHKEFKEMVAALKSEFEKDVVGCPSQCPSCGKFCEREIHPNQGKCQIKTGHQISSMGGKVWGIDKDKTAVLFMCDDYKDHTQVFLPCGVMEWGEFKDKCGNEWNWILPNDEKYRTKQQFNQKTMIDVWNKFGRGILNYYYKTEKTQITYVPYTSYEEVNQALLPVKYFICFVIDGTGSMSSDIARAKVSVGQLIQHFLSRGNSSEFRIVIYRDHCDSNILETFPSGEEFTPLQNTVEDFLNGVKVGGGGDGPEAVLDGLVTAAMKSDWKTTNGTRNKIIHIFDAPPHGEFPHYKSHDTGSDKGYCCCCNHGTICHFDWEKDVWNTFKEFNIEYHGINTSSSYPNYESKMKKELGHLCHKFQVVGKEVVNDAILQIFVNINKKT